MNDTRLLQQFLDDLPDDIPRPPITTSELESGHIDVSVEWYLSLSMTLHAFVDNGVVICMNGLGRQWRLPDKNSGEPYAAVVQHIRDVVGGVKEFCKANGMVALRIRKQDAAAYPITKYPD